MHPVFEVFKSNSNYQYYFRLKAENGQIILASEGYTTKENCLNGVTSVKQNSPYDSNYLRRTASNGQYYFNLKSMNNGQVIGTSELYVSQQGRENGINSVKRNAPVAHVIDLTNQQARV
ncbi:YegP family protein [Shewanella algae]|uniref:YegP family protein n=1 Tax=Shewanella algae TaxID=38313 RepID=UPI0031F4DAC9